ncbi:hypothetical protein [Pararhodonellum marinum]|uniref:hypothetical protein n=1 Tax=Pararhodonellum marinum TaxID=2755358 RepID=UPI0021D1CC8B|nr:hypothetical protein [Pararhodonellum marinum]
MKPKDQTREEWVAENKAEWEAVEKYGSIAFTGLFNLNNGNDKKKKEKEEKGETNNADNSKLNGELDFQKYPVGADLYDKPDKLLQNLLEVFDWLQRKNGLIRQPGNENPDAKFFHITQLIKNIPINKKGDTFNQT